MKLDLSAEGWGRVIVYTVLGTLVCVTAALYVDSFNFPLYDDEARSRAIIVSCADLPGKGSCPVKSSKASTPSA